MTEAQEISVVGEVGSIATMADFAQSKPAVRIVDFPGRPGTKIGIRALTAKDILTYLEKMDEVKKNNKGVHALSVKVALSLCDAEGKDLFPSFDLSYSLVLGLSSDAVLTLGVVVEEMSPLGTDEIRARAKK